MAKVDHFASPLVVLLTATLAPRGASTARIEERRRQYEQALDFWLRYPDPRITGLVYCDNSTPELDWVRNLAERIGGGRMFETLYCPDNDMPNGVHYGYAELGIVDHCLRESVLLGQSKYFAKVTGRFKFPRFSRLLDALPPHPDACIDYRRAYGRENKTWSKFRARTQLMLFRTEFYRRRIQDRRGLMVAACTGGRGISHIEEFLPGILAPGEEDGSGVVFRWPVECRPSGVGGNGENFDSARRRMKSFAFAVCRRFMPWYWI